MAGGGDGVGAAGRVLAAGRGGGGVETAVGGVRRLVMSRVSLMLVLPDATHVCVRVRWRASAYAFGCVCVGGGGGAGGGRRGGGGEVGRWVDEPSARWWVWKCARPCNHARARVLERLITVI